MPPPLRNQRTPMLGRTPASVAAFSLDAPRAIASQNLTRCSLRPAGGRPRPRVPAAAARSMARLLLGIATPQRWALRPPVEFTPSSKAQTLLDPTRPDGRSRRTRRDPSPQPRPTRTTPDDPPAANHAGPGASGTTAHDRTPRSS